MDEAEKWEDHGITGVRSVLAEVATAQFARTKDPDTQWFGGQKRGYDVASVAGRHGAKHVELDKDGFIVLTRRNGEPFSLDRVDRLMLVRLDTSTSYRVDLTARTVRLEAEAAILDMWDVPVDVLNDVMPSRQDDDPQWRNVLLDPDALAGYKVI